MPEPFSSPIDQLGIVVPDLEAEIKTWLERGVGPFFTIGGAMLSGYEYEGKKSSPRVNGAFGQVGPLQIELIHPIDDEPSIFRDFIEAGDDGLHHFGWFSDDLQADRKAAEAAGLKELQHGSVLGSGFSYYELAEPIASPAEQLRLDGTTGPGADAALSIAGVYTGRITELLAPDKRTREMVAHVREASAAWDGKTDPVRHLLGPMMEGAFQLQTLVQRVGRWFRERI